MRNISNINESIDIISVKELTMKQNMIWNSVGNVIYLFAQWIMTYLVTKLLGFENAGTFSLAMSLGNTFFTVAAYGMRNYQVSDTKNEHSDNTYFVSRIVTSIIAAIICIIYAFFQDFSIFQKLCIIVFTFFKISEAIVDIYHAIDQRVMRMDIIGKSFLIRSFITLGVFSITAIITKNLLIAIVALTISSFAFVVTYDRIKANKFFINKSTDFQEIKKILIKCLPLALFNFLFTLFATIPRIFLENEYGSELLGIYASIALPAVIVQVLCNYIFSPFTTIFARLYNERNVKEFIKLFLKISGILLIVAVVSVLGGLLLGELGLSILFGKAILPYVNLLVPIIFITILSAFSWFISMLLIVVRNFKALTIASIVSTIICLAFSSIFVKAFYLNGASYIAIVSFLVQIAIMLIFLFYSMKKFINSK